MACRLWIRNGRVVDPSRNLDGPGDVLVENSKIVPFSPGRAAGAEEIIDAEGCLVLPGLIDFHIHIAHWMADNAVHPDLVALPNGVTSAVDAGSVGTAAAEAFIRTVIPASEITVRSFMHAGAIGVTTCRFRENADPEKFDRDRARYLFERYGDVLLGLKIRLGATFSDGLGVSSLVAAKQLAGEFGRPVCVHLTNSPVPCADYLAHLDAGDILCHCYQGIGKHTILDDNGNVSAAFREARRRGVVFDSAMADLNFNVDIMRKCFAQGFLPDVISTDLIAADAYGPKVFALPYVMSLHLALGMGLSDVVRACTLTPAGLMGLAGKIGTLAPGADADIAIFSIREKPMSFPDLYGNAVAGTRLLVPQATVKAGRVAYKRIDFAF